MTLAILLEIALKTALIAGSALALVAASKRLPAAQRAWVAHLGLVLALITPFWVLFGPRLEMTGPWSRTSTAPMETAAPLAPAMATTPASLVAPAGLLDAGALAMGLYALIAGLVLAALGVSLWRLLRLQRAAAVLTEPAWLCALAQAQQRMGMKQGMALLQNSDLSSPVSWGLLRPTIMINPALLPSADKAEAVLAHELAHVVRMDWLNLMIARLATAILWFNPLVWLLAWQAHELREEAADDVVLRGEVRRSDYAALLVDFARRERAGYIAAAHAVSPSKSALKRRLTRVLDPEAQRDPAAPAWGLSSALTALLIAAPVAAFSPVDHAPARESAARAAAAAPSSTHDASADARARDLAALETFSPGAAARARAESDEAPTAEARATPARAQAVSPETLIALRVHGVTPEYIDAIERAYPAARAMDYEALIGFRALGVTPEWLRGVTARYPNLRPDEVNGFAAMGVDGAYIRELDAAGLRPTADELTALRAHGVTAAYVRELEAAGMTQLSAQDVLELRVHGVTGEEVRAIAPRRGGPSPPGPRRRDPPLEGAPPSGPPPDIPRND